MSQNSLIFRPYNKTYINASTICEGCFKKISVKVRWALSCLSAERLRAKPVIDEHGRKTLELEGATSLGQMINGSNAENHIILASPRGFEPRLPP